MVLDEYLVRLGYRNDEEGWRKFSSGIQRATTTALSLGVTVAGAATVVAGAVAKIAHQYDSLYFMSQRTRAMVSDIRGFGFAGKQVGISYDQAAASVETFAEKIRNNPGIAALVRGMGIGTNDPTKAVPLIVEQLKNRFGEGRYFGASAIAQQVFGIDERTFKQMWDNVEKLKRQQVEYAERVRESGVDMQGLASKSREFVQASDGMTTSLGLLADQTAEKWLPSMTASMKTLDGWLRLVLQLGKETDGWSSSVISLVSALTALTGSSWLLGALGLTGAAAVAGGTAAVGLGGAVGAAAVAGALRPQETVSWGERMAEKVFGVKPLLGDNWKNDAEKRQQVIRFFKSQGWSAEQATGMAASLHGESGLNPQAFNPAGGGRGAIGIGQWRGPRIDKFRELYGKDLKDASLIEQLTYHQWETANTEKAAGDAIRNAKSAREAAMVHSRSFERHGNAGEDARRGAVADMWFGHTPLAPGVAAGGAQVTISQKTDITVNGAGSPSETAAAVAGSQDRVNGDIVRNAKGAVR